MDRRASAGSRGFTLIETMTAIALLTIALGLMVSLSRHVRAASADELTKEILHRLDAAMAVANPIRMEPFRWWRRSSLSR